VHVISRLFPSDGSHHDPPADFLRSYIITSWSVDLSISHAIDIPVGPEPTIRELAFIYTLENY